MSPRSRRSCLQRAGGLAALLFAAIVLFASSAAVASKEVRENESGERRGKVSVRESTTRGIGRSGMLEHFSKKGTLSASKARFSFDSSLAMEL